MRPVILAGLRTLAVGTVYPPHLLGGYEVIWRGAMRHLREQGHEARILTTGYRRDDVAPDAPEDPDVHRELEWYWENHEWRRLSLRQSYALERHNATVFDRHVLEFAPDVITWWPVGGLSLGLVERARATGIPSVFFMLDYWPTYGPRHDLWTRMWAGRPRAARWAQRLTGLPTRLDLPSAGRWLFCSEAARRETLDSTGLEFPNYAILPAGVEEEYLEAGPGAAPARWNWKLLYVGRVVEQKGLETAIEALPLLPDEATLRVVGEGDQPNLRRLRELARRLQVTDRVLFEPQRSRAELFDVYREADAVVFPVLWTEPWGLVPLEAMALGRPVIATGRGGSGDYLRHGENSLLFEGGDAASLAAALRTLAGDAALRERLRDGGLATAGRFSEAEFNRRALAELEACIGAGSAARG